jgi:predicted nucleic acid-binding protein
MADKLVNYIVDTSIVIQHLITDTHSANADVLFDELGDTLMIHIPEFCLLECANVLWKRVRFHGMPSTIAEELIENLVALPLQIVPTGSLLKRGLQIGLKHQLAVYDSIYIAMAENLKFQLISDDVKQDKAAIAEGVTTKSITDFKP